MPKRKRGITGDAARRRKAIRKVERRADETVEERNKRLAAMTQRDQEERAEKTEEQRGHRLAAMAQRYQERRAEETEEQSSYRLSTMAQRARRRRVNVTEEQNCLQNTRRAYTQCCHNGKIIEKPSTYPVEMKELMDGSHDLSQHFKKNIRSYNSALSFASMGAQIVLPAGRGAYCFRIHGQIYHRTSHLHPAQA
ncbi:ATP-dependent DNA helicase [Trichonephila clavipes]|nr:ATP-dependent DNA helicase [Trichonephila clavipes]